MKRKKARKVSRNRRPQLAQRTWGRPDPLAGLGRRDRAHLRVTAFHEAGHVVAEFVTQLELGRYWLLSVRVFVRSLTEVKRGPYVDWRLRELDAAGGVEGPNIHTPFVRLGLPAGAAARAYVGIRVNVTQEVVVRLAGPLAEARLRRLSPLYIYLAGGDEDLDLARACGADLYRDTDDLTEFLRDAERRAHRIMKDHWAAVEKLAAALMERRRMTAAAALRLIGPMIGWPPEYMPPEEPPEGTAVIG